MDKNIILILLRCYNEGFATQYFTLKKSFSRLKLNINKCEIYGLVIMKGAQEAVCVLQNINLTKSVTQSKH